MEKRHWSPCKTGVLQKAVVTARERRHLSAVVNEKASAPSLPFLADAEADRIGILQGVAPTELPAATRPSLPAEIGERRIGLFDFAST